MNAVIKKLEKLAHITGRIWNIVLWSDGGCNLSKISKSNILHDDYIYDFDTLEECEKKIEEIIDNIKK